jgi:RES domain-containing protein
VRLWRISNHADLSGRGGLLASGRWHRIGTPVVYAADHPATAMLEALAHLDFEDAPAGYRLMGIDVPNDAPSHRVKIGELPADWALHPEMTRDIGTALLSRTSVLTFLVPSALVPAAWDALLNPRHPAMGRCVIAEVLDGAFDPRLIR